MVKINLNKLINTIIIIYITIILTSHSTGTMLVKGSRIITIISLIAYLMLKRKTNDEKISTNKLSSKYILWILGFLTYTLIECKFALSYTNAIENWKTVFYIFIINLFIYKVSKYNKSIIPSIAIGVILGATIKACIIYSSYGLFAFLSSRNADGVSANSIGFYSAISCFLIIIINILNDKYKTEGKINKLFLLILFIVNLLAVIMSASRKALIYLIIPLFAYFIIYSKKNKINYFKVMFRIVFSMMVIYFAYLIIMNNEFLYNLIGIRIETMVNGLIGSGTIDASTKTRLSLIESGMEWFKTKPLFGYGLNNYSYLFQQHYKMWNIAYYSHNNYVELLVDTGIVGTIIYYIIYFIAFRNIILSKEKIKKIFLGILIALLVCDYGMVSYYEPLTQLLLLMIMIVLSMKEDDLHNENSKENNRKIVN